MAESSVVAVDVPAPSPAPVVEAPVAAAVAPVVAPVVVAPVVPVVAPVVVAPVVVAPVVAATVVVAPVVAVDAQKWADIEAEEDFAPSFEPTYGVTGFESKPDKGGVKTVTNYTKNSKGETIKSVKRVKVTRKHHRINKAVYHRAQRMVAFGLEASDNGDADDAAYTAIPLDNYIIEVPKNIRTSHFRTMNNEDDDTYYFMDLSNFTKPTRDLKQKFKALSDSINSGANAGGEGGGGEQDGGDAKEKKGDDEEKPTRYVPPAKRAGRDGSDARTMEQQQKEECTVRVTNLSEDVKETDLTDLFGTAGKIHRVYLAKHKETKFSKGFAFITYMRREEAARAITDLNRHGYDNLLLNVEWAKPSNRERT
eukprot:GHVS01079115.1.p1 GENE.GHVS01079115.1~~GHVS01079115.1.p1  ORF type:complete len:367 (-),score=74.49 GHVS01079115.1:200-1300(-)